MSREVETLRDQLKDAQLLMAHFARLLGVADSHEAVTRAIIDLTNKQAAKDEVIAAAREYYMASETLRLNDGAEATEDDFFRAGVAARDLREALLILDGKEAAIVV